MAKPQLEFADGRAPFDLGGKQTIIGRGAQAALRADGPGVADQHARIVLDQGSGNFWVEDLKSPGGTFKNGQRLAGKAWLVDGDTLAVGNLKVTFRPEGAQVAEQRTVMSMEPPQAVKDLIAKQQAVDAAKKAPAPVDDGRTMQADAPQIAQAQAQPRKATVMGLGGPPKQPAKLPPPPAAPSPVPDTSNPFATQAEMAAPMIPAAGPVADAANPFATQAEMAAPAIPAAGPISDGNNPFATQAEMAAPVIPQPGKRPNVSPAAFEQTSLGAAPSPGSYPTPAPAPAAQQWQPPPQKPAGSGFTPPPQAAISGTQPIMAAPMAMGGAVQPAQQPYNPPKTPQAMQPIAGPSGGGAWQSQAYTPPKKGSFGGISRAIEFYGQIFSLAFKHKSLLMPLVYDLVITTALSIALAIGDFFIASNTIYYVFAAVGTAMLYFIDYFCNSLTASLIYDQVTTGQSSTKQAWPRIMKAMPGILTFAAVSAALDLASTWARERRDILARILLDILRKIWSTATYVVMPALVIEGVSFGTAFKRSKDLMKQDPTGVGSGIVAMSLTSYVVGLVMFGLAGMSLRFFGGFLHGAVGLFFFFFFCNAFWAVSGWMKISYSTLFYMWAKECERANSTDFALAPQPLRAALDAA